ncbi:MAG: hypothetical protein ACLFVC_06990 [Opitutales bacterium]
MPNADGQCNTFHACDRIFAGENLLWKHAAMGPVVSGCGGGVFAFVMEGMSELIDWMQEHEALLGALGVLSVVTFLASLAVFPLIIVFLPADYFVRQSASLELLKPWRLALRVLKNLFGALIFVLGVLMLFLPGQGILGILVGCSLMDFPGKRRLQLSLLRRRHVRRSVDWIRRKAKREPLEIPEAAKEST